MRGNIVKQKLAQAQAVFGAALTLGSVRSTEIAARAGFDFLMVDTLHGHFDKTTATNALRAIAMTDTVPFARVAHNDPGRINELLDAGALAMIVPMVSRAAEAQAAVASTFYHPKGERSKGSAVATFYGSDYHTLANETVALVVMIETARAVERADEILSVPGIDACLIGTGDLSLSLGCDKTSRAFEEAVQKVADACAKHGIAAGIAEGSAEACRRWQDRGLSFFLVSHDVLLVKQSLEGLAQSLREALSR